MPRTELSAPSVLGRFGAAAILSALIAGCVASGGAVGTVHDGPSATQASQAPATPAGPPSTGFYLMAWQTQALAPQETFGWLPVATIADGQYIDGRVAIPMILTGAARLRTVWVDIASSAAIGVTASRTMTITRIAFTF